MKSQQKDGTTRAGAPGIGSGGGSSGRRVRRTVSTPTCISTMSQSSTFRRPLLVLVVAAAIARCGVEAFSDMGARRAAAVRMPSTGAGRSAWSAASARIPGVPAADKGGEYEPAAAAAQSVLFASPSSSSTTARDSPSNRRARILAALVAHAQRFRSTLRQHTQPVRRILAVLLLATAVFLGGTSDPALAGRSGGRAGGSFGRSSYRPPPISRMHRPGPGSMGSRGGRGMGGGSPMLHPGMYRRHPAVYFMPRPGVYGRGLGGSGAAVADAPTTNQAEDAAGASASSPNGAGSADLESGEVIEMKDLIAANGRTSPNVMNSRRGTRVIDPISYYAALTGVYGLIVYKSNRSKNARGDGGTNGAAASSALGPGISVGSLTLSLDISDRDDPANALARIGDIAKKANTRTRKGVQSLVADVSLELLRQEAAVSSACSSYAHLSSEGAAERTYYQLSTVERSKFDRESINKFGGKKGLEEVIEDADNLGRVSGEVPTNKATSAVVTIIYQIEGDQTKIPTITSRSDLKNVLLRVAADAQTEECLLGAEVLWTPERRGDSMTEQEVVSLYPELRIL